MSSTPESSFRGSFGATRKPVWRRTTCRVETCLGLLLVSASSSSAFTMPSPRQQSCLLEHRSGAPQHHAHTFNNHRLNQLQLQATTATETSTQEEQDFDKLLEDTTELMSAVQFFKSHPDIEVTRDRWNRIFDSIEEVTAVADRESINIRQEQESPLISKSRMEMTDMYSTLKDQGHLRLFGSIAKEHWPASGSHTVRPTMLEEITSLSMTALTPKPSNTLLYAGIATAVLEGIASVALGLNYNVLVFLTIGGFLADRILLNGALSETAVKIISPETQPKITRHEAGHFLCAYLLGCPVEGYVLSAWAALQDARFGTRAVSAGTSFFDPILSSQIASSKVTRSSIDRYAIIVMAGIAAEAVNYGRADGGAGDEMALIAFLSNLNGGGGGGRNNNSPAWNDVTIRNEARWGALQAVLILREYQECYDALVDALERGGSLGDCIYAIENAGRENNKSHLKKPLGYILERPGGLVEEWVTELPAEFRQNEETTGVAVAATKVPQPKPLDAEQSLETLKEYKELMTAKLKDINEKLGGL